MELAEIKGKAVILLVDDDPDQIVLLGRMLRRDGYAHVHSTTNPAQTIDLFRSLQPDLVVLDLHMPGTNGYLLMDALQSEIPQGTFLPILVISGDMKLDARKQALVLGAKDFIHKPFDVLEVQYRIANLLQVRFMYRQMHQMREVLARRTSRQWEDEAPAARDHARRARSE